MRAAHHVVAGLRICALFVRFSLRYLPLRCTALSVTSFLVISPSLSSLCSFSIASRATSFAPIPLIFKCARRWRHSHHSIPHRTGITPRPAIPPFAVLIFLSSPALLDPHPVLNFLCCTVEAALFTLCRSSAFVSLTYIKY
ncbi:hypothetical protein B0H13DRAFT_2365849 [Mycena leptocephala]|nr:hypothetical protein B0H13DRAFT_2365849 [Mycena leptocephala]